MAEVLIWAAIWICGAPGALLVVTALAVSRIDLLALAIMMVVIGLIGVMQRVRSRPQPLSLLVFTSLAFGLVTPVLTEPLQVGVIASLLLVSFVAVLTLPRTAAFWFSVWCAMVGVGVLPWILRDVSWFEYGIASTLTVFVFVTGWQLASHATDLLIRSEKSHRSLLQGSPVAILEEDYSAVGARLAELRAAGVVDLEGYLQENVEELQGLVSRIRVTRANEKALEMIGADSFEDLVEGMAGLREEQELVSYIDQFVAVWDGRTELAIDLAGRSLRGEPFEAVLHFSVPRVRGEPDLGHVIITLSDIAPRKAVEERLSQLLESNQRLLESEHALVLSSRALLTGSGEDALESALGSLREASGADIAYLAMNVEDPDLGPSFHVVRSVIRPDLGEDEWVGTTHSWSKYQKAAETLQEGRPFQHIATETPGAGWNRSILSVPVLLEGRWVACVGFVDVAEKRVWDEQETRMLEAAAPMLGAFWEREKTRERLEDLVRSKDRFVASVSHELRTPLAAVLGFAEELRDNASSFSGRELTEMLELISTQSQEMADMVEDLLVSARIDTGISIRPEAAYLRAQVETVLAGLGKIAHKDIEVVGDRGRVWADPTRTRQIIRNLVTNAIKYGGERVMIETVEGEETTVLTVVDDGPGLDEDQWGAIFEPYHRAHEATTQPASIGLGLTVSRQLARMMGGDLNYECGQRGSAFTLVLPATAVDPRVAVSVADELASVRTGY